MLAIWGFFASWRRDPTEGTRVSSGTARFSIFFLATFTCFGAALAWFYIFVYSSQMPPGDEKLALGTQVPALELPTHDGKRFALRSPEGKGLILDVFRGHW